jgi:hypothetical protein
MRNKERQYHEDADSDPVRSVVGGKPNYRKRPQQQKRRKVPKAAHPGYGIGGRRKPRLDW